MAKTASCSTGKVSYRDEMSALIALAARTVERDEDLRRGERTRRHERGAYHCMECSYWHLTSRNGTQSYLVAVKKSVAA